MKKYIFCLVALYLWISGLVFTNETNRAFGNGDDLGWVKSVAFSPDGKYFVTGGQDGKIKIWNLQSGSLHREMKARFTGTCEINAVDFSADGKMLAIAEQYVVSVWDFASNKEIYLLDGHDFSVVNAIKFAPDGKYLVSGSFDKTAKLWDLGTGKSVKTFKNGAEVDAIDISKDGKFLATGGGGNCAKMWDITSGKLLKTFKMPEDKFYHVTSVQFSSNGKSMLVSSDRALILWNAETGLEIKTYKKGGNGAERAMFNKEEDKIISAEYLGGAYKYGLVIRETESGSEVAKVDCHKNEAIRAIALSNDGKLIATGSNDNTSKIVDANEFKVLSTFVHSASNNSVFTFTTVGTDKGATLYAAKLRDEVYFKVVNNSSSSVYVTVKVTIKCQSMGLGSVTYETFEVLKHMSVNPGATRSAEDANHDDYIVPGCKGKTVSSEITAWSIQNN